jgi:hypothetical protein
MMNETLKRIGTSKGWSDEETTSKFAVFVQESFPEVWTQNGNKLDGLDADDLDFFSASFDVSMNRRTGGGGGKGEEWVGMIVAYNGRRDTMERQRTLAVDSAEGNLAQALRYGMQYNGNPVGIGRAYLNDGGDWVLVDADDKQVHSEKASDKPPRWVIPINGGQMHIAMIGSKNGGKYPKPAFMPKREWVFIGNKKDLFLSDGPLPPRTLECSFESADLHLQMHRPIRFKAEEAEGWPDKTKTILRTGNMTASYDLEWVPDAQLDKATAIFKPDQFMAQFMDVVDLNDLWEYHDANATTSPNGKTYGPTFAISGVVDYIDYDGKEAPSFIEGGFKHSLTISSNSLRRDNPDASLWVELTRYLVDNHQALKVLKQDGWKPYARGSRVWIVVRSRTWDATDGSRNMSLDGLSTYAMPMRSIVAQEPDAQSSDLTGLNDFSGGA